MKQCEKDAIIIYLDAQLDALCRDIEKDLNPDAVSTMYENVYALLNDLDETIDGHIEADGAIATNK